MLNERAEIQDCLWASTISLRKQFIASLPLRGCKLFRIFEKLEQEEHLSQGKRNALVPC